MPTIELLTSRNTATRPKRIKRSYTAYTERAVARVGTSEKRDSLMKHFFLILSPHSGLMKLKYCQFICQFSLAFVMATDLAPDPEYQLFVSLKCYEAAYELLISDALKDHASDQLAQVLKRLGNIRNEMGVYYMNQAAAMQTEKEGIPKGCKLCTHCSSVYI